MQGCLNYSLIIQFGQIQHFYRPIHSALNRLLIFSAINIKTLMKLCQKLPDGKSREEP